MYIYMVPCCGGLGGGGAWVVEKRRLPFRFSFQRGGLPAACGAEGFIVEYDEKLRIFQLKFDDGPLKSPFSIGRCIQSVSNHHS